jgi:hypothetical protein
VEIRLPSLVVIGLVFVIVGIGFMLADTFL